MAYLLACNQPDDRTVNVWAIPEPVLHTCLLSLPFKEGGDEYTIQIRTTEQRVDGCADSPDLIPYSRRFQLTPEELLILAEAREADASVKRERENARADEELDTDTSEGSSAAESSTSTILENAAQQLTEESAFDSTGIVDARERVLSSIVRRRGQPAFRKLLLTAYNGRCAVTGCDLEAVLEAAHIVPYRGPNTNHPCNGLLLRSDLHTLFDLKLIAVDIATMSLLVDPSLAGTCYEEYRGKPIRVPNDPGSRPSRGALEQHRRESHL